MRNLIIPAVIALAGVLGAPHGAEAQQGTPIETLVCESVNNGHNECRYNATGVVTVSVNRQISSTRCVFDRNWGTFDGGVWVDYGCRAEFVVRRPPGEAPSRPIGGNLQTINCESMNNARQTCRIDGLDTRTIHLERKLSGSPCIMGYSFGYSDGENSPPGIWVDHGCRATFSYRLTSAGGAYQPYGGTPHDFEMSCDSRGGAWNHCNVPSMRSARVERLRGNAACNTYKAWGVDDTGIWVRNNCQGVFRIRYRHGD